MRASRLSDDQVKVLTTCSVFYRPRRKPGESRTHQPAGTARLRTIRSHSAPARDSDIAVAGRCCQLSRLRKRPRGDCQHKGQDHLPRFRAEPTSGSRYDVIVDRGERKVIRKLANNGARAFPMPAIPHVAHAEADAELVEFSGFGSIFLPNSCSICCDARRGRSRPAEASHCELQEEIKRVEVHRRRRREAISRPEFHPRRTAREADERLERAERRGRDQVAETKKFDEIAARSPSSTRADRYDGATAGGTPDRPRPDSCKSAGWSWCVEAVLQHRPSRQKIDEVTMKVAWRDYGKAVEETAQRTLRFWQVHNKLEK